MNYILLIFSVIGGLVIGGLVVFLVNRYLLATRSKTILEEAEKEAEVIKKNKLLEVKEKFIHMKAEMEKQANARNAKIQSAEAKLKQREMQLSQQQQDLQKKKSETDAIRANLDTQLEMPKWNNSKNKNWKNSISPKWNGSNTFRESLPKKRKNVW